ncbi:aldo/keto reductase [Caldovatus aquaticus]|uniref:Aldo/keto reductase n=1 Tax=Caldovatus aquaticus TaxID=2865671 RepID=A0ABS7F173_9PROT|nr:aldo/keto reductase [Caldovatus aquaticus]MBW8269370.1 aldo/keto reductase [Caldovatus aquaticus]
MAAAPPSPAIPALVLPHAAGVRMPRLGLGTWPMAGAECRRAVESALGLGYRHLDTAAMYGNEADIGAAIAGSGVPREEIFVVTKVWYDRLTPEGIRASCAASLRRLRLAHADLFLVHWPRPDMDLAAVLGALRRLKEDGLARATGLCNVPPGLLRRALEIAPEAVSCVQVEYHLYLSQARLLEITRPRGIPLTAYAPVAKGAAERDPAVRRIATKHGCTPSQVALAWLLRQDLVAAIPKAASEAHQRANLAALALRLDAEDLAAIAALPKDRRLVDPSFAPDWES